MFGFSNILQSFTNSDSKKEKEEENEKEKVQDFNVRFNPQLYGEHLSRGFLELLKTGEFTDLILVAGKEEIKAHKVVLCSWSETFRLMFENQNWKESHTNRLEVAVEQDDLASFKKMISYMYCEPITVHIDDMVGLLALSNYYGVFSLKEACGDVLAQSIDEDSVFYLLDVVNQYSVKSLNAKCGQFLAENFGELLKQDKLMPIGVSTWVEMLKSDDLQVRSEEDVLSAVMRYAGQFETQKRLDVLEQMLPHIRWTSLSASYLTKKVESNPVFTGLPVIHDILYEAFKLKVCPKAPSVLINVRTRKGIVRWTAEKSDANVKINSALDTATNNRPHQGWTTAFAEPAINGGLHYFEVDVKFQTYLMIGVATEGSTAQLNTYPSQTAQGWSWYSVGQVYHTGQVQQTSTTFASGSKIGLLIDADSHVLQFYSNGVKGPTVQNISSSPVVPWVSFYANGDSAKLVPASLPDDYISKKKKQTTNQKRKAN